MPTRALGGKDRGGSGDRRGRGQRMLHLIEAAPGRKSQVRQAELAAPRALAPSQWDPGTEGPRGVTMTLVGSISSPLSNAPGNGASSLGAT